MHSETSQIDTEVQYSEKTHIYCTLLHGWGGLEELWDLRQ